MLPPHVVAMSHCRSVQASFGVLVTNARHTCEAATQVRIGEYVLSYKPSKRASITSLQLTQQSLESVATPIPRTAPLDGCQHLCLSPVHSATQVISRTAPGYSRGLDPSFQLSVLDR